MNINKIYSQLVEGKITQDQFMQQARLDPYVKSITTSVMSFNDVIKILSNKSIITITEIKKVEYKQLNEECTTCGELAEEQPKYNPEDQSSYKVGGIVDDDENIATITPDKWEKMLKWAHSSKVHLWYALDDLERHYMVDGRVDIENPEFEYELAKILHDHGIVVNLNWEIVPNPRLNESKSEIPKIEVSEEDKLNARIDRIDPGQFRNALKYELEKQKVKDVKKATKKAIDNLEKDTLYYTRKENGLKKEPKNRTDLPTEVKKNNFIDKANQMKKSKKKINEELESNEITRQVQQFILSNPTLKNHARSFSLHPEGSNQCIIQYDYWNFMPNECLQKFELQFKVERQTNQEPNDFDGTDDRISYIATEKHKIAPKDLGVNKFKEGINTLVKEVIDELTDQNSSNFQDKIGRINTYAKAAKMKDYETLAEMSWSEQEFFESENTEYYKHIREKYQVDEENFGKVFQEYVNNNSFEDDTDPAGGHGLDSHLEESGEPVSQIKPGAIFTLGGKLGKFQPGDKVTVQKVEREEKDIRVDFTNDKGETDSFYFDPNDTLEI